MLEMYREYMNTFFDATLVTPLTEQSFTSMGNTVTLVLFYNMESDHAPKLKRIYENLARIALYEKITLHFGAMELNAFPGVVQSYATVLPLLYLFIAGIPIMYQGPFNINAIHIWIKQHLCNCYLQNTV